VFPERVVLPLSPISLHFGCTAIFLIFGSQLTALVQFMFMKSLERFGALADTAPNEARMKKGRRQYAGSLAAGHCSGAQRTRHSRRERPRQAVQVRQVLARIGA
jgi:hypothetical protein